MMGLELVLSTVLGTARDALPVVAVIVGFQLFVIRRPVPHLKRVVLGVVYVIAGLSLFLFGLEKALFPLGREMAEQLTSPQFIHGTADVEGRVVAWTDYYWAYLFAFAIGFGTTVAEPALIAVAVKAREVSGGAIHVWGLRVAVALGVASGTTLGVYRIVIGAPIHYFIIAGYVVVLVQTFFAPKLIIALAYDSGGVTTSTVTVPLLAALGLGLAQSVPGRSPLIDGFGLIAFASLFPIMAVMAFAQIAAWRERSNPAAARGETKGGNESCTSSC